MTRINYAPAVVAVLKAVAVSQVTITSGDLAWAINYQRVTRSINELLAELRPIFEDRGWPPLTSLVVLKSTKEPSPIQNIGPGWRLMQRQCWAWARERSDDRQRVRGAHGWDDSIKGDTA